TKIGTGTLTFTGANTYTGLTTVQNGDLVLGPNAQNGVLNLGGPDVRGGKLVFDYNGGTSPTGQVQSILAGEYGNKFASGRIPTSRAPHSHKGIGYSDNTGTSKLTVAYTYYGDADLSLKVDSDDFAALS